MDRAAVVLPLLLLAAFAGRAEPPPEAALWNAGRSAAAVSARVDGRASVTAFVRQADGSFLKIDLSQVEQRNLGKLGPGGAEYERVETQPLQWLERRDGLLQLRIHTRAWRQGQRYTVEEPVIFQADGQVLWR